MRRPSLPSPLSILTPPPPPSLPLPSPRMRDGPPTLRPRSASFSVYEERVEEEARRGRAELRLKERGKVGKQSPLLPGMGSGEGRGKVALQVEVREEEERGGETEEEGGGELSAAMAGVLSPIYEQPMDFLTAGHVQVTSP